MKFLYAFFIVAVVSIWSAAPIAFAQYYPAYYHIASAPQPLSCSASRTTVAGGELVTFTATGGSSPVYNWTTAERTYLNAGPQLTVALYTPGAQTVSVSAGPQVAACAVTVTGAATTTGVVAQAHTYPVTYLAAQYIPNMPNTGFAPVTATSVAFAAVLLFAAGLFVSPYVKRTLASTFR